MAARLPKAIWARLLDNDEDEQRVSLAEADITSVECLKVELCKALKITAAPRLVRLYLELQGPDGGEPARVRLLPRQLVGMLKLSEESMVLVEVAAERPGDGQSGDAQGVAAQSPQKSPERSSTSAAAAAAASTPVEGAAEGVGLTGGWDIPHFGGFNERLRIGDEFFPQPGDVPVAASEGKGAVAAATAPAALSAPSAPAAQAAAPPSSKPAAAASKPSPVTSSAATAIAAPEAAATAAAAAAAAPGATRAAGAGEAKAGADQGHARALLLEFIAGVDVAVAAASPSAPASASEAAGGGAEAGAGAVAGAGGARARETDLRVAQRAVEAAQTLLRAKQGDVDNDDDDWGSTSSTVKPATSTADRNARIAVLAAAASALVAVQHLLLPQSAAQSAAHSAAQSAPDDPGLAASRAVTAVAESLRSELLFQVGDAGNALAAAESAIELHAVAGNSLGAGMACYTLAQRLLAAAGPGPRPGAEPLPTAPASSGATHAASPAAATRRHRALALLARSAGLLKGIAGAEPRRAAILQAWATAAQSSGDGEALVAAFRALDEAAQSARVGNAPRLRSLRNLGRALMSVAMAPAPAGTPGKGAGGRNEALVAEAAACFQRCVAILEADPAAAASPAEVGATLNMLGTAEAAQGRHGAALEAWTQAAQTLERTGAPKDSVLEGNIRACRARLAG